jgi:large subunit ribosomal protein L15
MLNNIRPTTPRKDAKTIGRGGKRGKTSGRGTKGQWAHGGHGVRPEIRDMIKKLPKLRGRGIHPNKPVSNDELIVNLSYLAKAFAKGETVSAETLVAKRFSTAHQIDKFGVKVLAYGELTVPLSVVGLSVSASAKAKIEAAGGSVV